MPGRLLGCYLALLIFSRSLSQHWLGQADARLGIQAPRFDGAWISLFIILLWGVFFSIEKSQVLQKRLLQEAHG